MRQAEVDRGVELEAEAGTPAQAERELGRLFGGAERGTARVLDADEAAHLGDGGEADRQRHRGGHAVRELRADVQVAEVAPAAHDEAGVDRRVDVAPAPLADEAEAAGERALTHEARRSRRSGTVAPAMAARPKRCVAEARRPQERP